METIVILGGGESGWGTARLARNVEQRVFLSDSGTLEARYREALTGAGIDFEEGGHDRVFGMCPTCVVKSPGIPDTAPVVRHFAEVGIPVISEIEYAKRYSRGRTICITGSNGKTTTATLVHRILCRAGYDAALAGNVGDSYAARVAENDAEWYVLELSSFQLDGMFSFRADIALLLNITPDHLDRYDYDMEKYAASKMRIAANQTPEDYLIYNACDRTVIRRAELAASRAGKLPFSTCRDGHGKVPEPHTVSGALRGGGYLEGGTITMFCNGLNFSMPAGELGISGKHNAGNAIAASLAAMAAGVDTATIEKVLHDFHGVEHRMEYAGTVGGVRFINDSKATNTDAAWYGLEGTPGAVVWIAGGTDKGNDYGELRKIAAGKVKALVCMGADNAKLVESFQAVIPQIFDTGSLDEAMQAALSAARPGDTVLLSPACASFDLFRNFETAGGRLFK
ncbi:MAG: UDP-N-acetylmuramoyl-L-alanine--D-glutamate ligase, partial [Rikenellaceae bacterium]|nr:UDP-N-acetylmuramoyl-L-alanine--D-glutamate ligase [Rikenellaceae bacterium]